MAYDDTLRRTMAGKKYTVKGYVVTPYELIVKALDEDEAEEFAREEVVLSDGERMEVEEIMEELL
ncbi:MAG TPA: hypothetical protein IAC14_00205 [Candidatus Scybalomonas excrementigallinarum]|nr:hypothetical protein [Candidatus Scybalomonas excrementigallinarum]